MTTNAAHFPYLSTCLARNIEEYCTAAAHFGQTVKQLSTGRFEGVTTTIRLADVTLMRRLVSVRHCTHCQVPPGATFVFQTGPHELYVRGRVIGANRQIGSLGNHEARLLVPADCEHLIVSIPLETLSRQLDADRYRLFTDTLAAIEQGEVDPHSKQLTTLRLLELFRNIEGARQPLTADELQASARQVIAILSDYLSYQQRQAPVSPDNPERILQRALALIAAHPTRLFTLEEMAKNIYASKRAIQYAFSSIVGMSPMRLQKKYRLNQIREELVKDPSSATFAHIVAKYSFSNAGRMSREYTELFGERPRDTMQRFLPDTNRNDAPDS